MSEITNHLTAEIVGACADAEREPSATYTESARLVTAYARRYGQDSQDVASVARVLLASILADGYGAHDGAALAVSRVSQWLAVDAVGSTRTPKIKTSAADTSAALVNLPSAGDYGQTDRIATWRTADTLSAIASESPADAAILATLAEPIAWHGDHVNVSAVTRLLGVSETTARARLTLALKRAESAAKALDRASLPTMPTGWDTAPSLERDTRVATSGTASPVVRTLASGQHWTTLADRSIRLSDAQAVATLCQYDALPAVTLAKRGESESAALGQPRDILPASRPQGVGIGLVHGYGARAGGGAPTPRPAVSRKRKRDGGIGSSMIPA